MSSITKSAYIRSLILGRVYNPALFNAALLYWHSGIPLKEANGYLDNYEAKLNSKSANAQKG